MKNRIIRNVVASLILEITSVICAFILPRMIISGFGSEYNGLVSSVTQFLSVVTLLRSGVGGVMRAALYRPLVEKDVYRISSIINATEHFMRRIAYIFSAFLVVFAGVYPVLVSSEFGWFYTFTLVLILGISTIAQYYFGITYQFLLSADQRSYVYSMLQTAATIFNTLFSVLLINAGVEFRLMKLISALVFTAIPIALYWYVHGHYEILRNVPRDDNCINQRWDAFVHQVAAFIHSNTDLMLLTVFTDLYQVSVYSIHNMVVTGVKKFVMVFTSGMESVIGKMIASGKREELVSFVDVYEWVISVISIIAFVCTAILIAPFMKVYTLSVTDADYIQPILGYLLVFASFLECIRLPYKSMVESAGHFKQTRNGAIVEASINIGVSLLFIKPFGSVGVAFGTVMAMAFRTLQYAIYSTKVILKRKYRFILKRVLITLINVLLIMLPYMLTGMDAMLMSYVSGYYSWIVVALFTFAVTSIVTMIVNTVAYGDILTTLIYLIRYRKR